MKLTPKKRTKVAKAIGQVLDEARVKTIGDTIAAFMEGNVHIEERDKLMRELAERLDVPFFVIWRLCENLYSSHNDADLDDIEEGLAWLDKHSVPRDLLRRTPTRRQEWEAEGEQNAEAAPAAKGA